MTLLPHLLLLPDALCPKGRWGLATASPSKCFWSQTGLLGLHHLPSCPPDKGIRLRHLCWTCPCPRPSIFISVSSTGDSPCYRHTLLPALDPRQGARSREAKGLLWAQAESSTRGFTHYMPPGSSQRAGPFPSPCPQCPAQSLAHTRSSIRVCKQGPKPTHPDRGQACGKAGGGARTATWGDGGSGIRGVGGPHQPLAGSQVL